jgi:hypothetical protein
MVADTLSLMVKEDMASARFCKKLLILLMVVSRRRSLKSSREAYEYQSLKSSSTLTAWGRHKPITPFVM